MRAAAVAFSAGVASAGGSSVTIVKLSMSVSSFSRLFRKAVASYKSELIKIHKRNAVCACFELYSLTHRSGCATCVNRIQCRCKAAKEQLLVVDGTGHRFLNLRTCALNPSDCANSATAAAARVAAVLDGCTELSAGT